MPQKKNPDPLEIIRGKSGLLLGSMNSVFSIVKSLPTGYSRDLQEIKPDSVGCFTLCTGLLANNENGY